MRSSTNIGCDYFIDHTFSKLVTKRGDLTNQLSLSHLNIKSLTHHYNELTLYLHLLKYKCGLIGLTETWLNDDISDLYG